MVMMMLPMALVTFSLQASCTVKSKDGQRMWRGGCRRPEDLHIRTCLKIVQVAFSAATDVESESEEKKKVADEKRSRVGKCG